MRDQARELIEFAERNSFRLKSRMFRSSWRSTAQPSVHLILCRKLRIRRSSLCKTSACKVSNRAVRGQGMPQLKKNAVQIYDKHYYNRIGTVFEVLLDNTTVCYVISDVLIKWLKSCSKMSILEKISYSSPFLLILSSAYSMMKHLV